jgi:hypothetical protein
MATLTAWAQTAQSIPKTTCFISLNSALAMAGHTNVTIPMIFRIPFIDRSF